MAEKTHPNGTLDIPRDIAVRLDRYAAELSKEYQFPVSRQQAWERLARTFLPAEGVTYGE